MLSLSGKRWLLPADNILVSDLFHIRNLNAPREIISPDVYPDMHKATTRIRTAIENNERIGIFGDYDCDGVTATAQLVRYCRRRHCEPYVRLPHRVHDGYGLNDSIVQEIRDAGVQLLITCDTGIASAHEVSLLSKSGIDVIITDHHSVPQISPTAYAIIHPALSTHPLPHPSGAGVVLALITALEDGDWVGIDEDRALAMCGTVADLVPLTGSNRALVQLGLQSLQTLRAGPLQKLRDACSPKNTVLTSIDIAFRIAPRLNAAGRMESADTALHALLDGGDALTQLEQLNEQRQELSRELLTTVIDTYDHQNSLLLMTVSDTYPHGIVGLIAGKLTEQFGKPSLVAHSDGTVCTASLRSPACYNIAEALTRAQDLLISHGGHAQAAGCTFLLSNAPALRERLEEDVRSRVEATLLVPTLQLDGIVSPTDITLDFCAQLKELEPFGQGNAEPIFLLKNVTLTDVRACGSDGTHVQARVGTIKAIGFGLAHLIDDASDAVDIACRIGVNEWNGKKEPQIFLQDMRIAVSS